MTKAEQARIVAWRLRILRHAEEEPRYVAQTCRYFGISRTAFYRWKKRRIFDRDLERGFSALHPGQLPRLLGELSMQPSVPQSLWRGGFLDDRD